MIYAQPGQPGAVVAFKSQYENYIGGTWVPPVKQNRRLGFHPSIWVTACQGY